MNTADQLIADVHEALLYLLLFASFIGAVFTIFIIMVSKGIKCKHENIITRTFFVGATCEDTADFCKDCGRQMSDVKTDCR